MFEITLKYSINDIYINILVKWCATWSDILCHNKCCFMVLFILFQDLSSFVTKGVKEIEHVMNVGNQNRAVGYVVDWIMPAFLPRCVCLQPNEHE